MLLSLKIHSQSVKNLGLSGISFNTDEWSIFSNPAGLSWHDQSFVVSSYINDLFISELDQKDIGIAFHRNSKSIGILYSGEGDKRLQKTRLSLLFSQEFNETFSLGLRLNYRQYAFGDIYGKRQLIYATFGFIIKSGRSNQIAFLINNPSRQFIDKKLNQRLESLVSLSFRHVFSQKFKIICELAKNLKRSEFYRLAMIYKALDVFEYSLSYDISQQRISSGFGLHLKSLNIEIAFSYISQLGVYSGLGISYQFTSKE